MKKILFSNIVLALLFITISCENEQTIYPLTDKAEASFPSTILNLEMVADDGNKIVVEMWRGNTKGAASVPVTITNNTGGVFTPEKQQFDFADGESVAYLTFSYPSIANFGGEKYQIILEIVGDVASPSAVKKMTVSAQRKLTYKSLGTGTFSSEFFEEEWPQEVLKAEEGDFYRLPNCYVNGTTMEFSIQDGKINFAKQATGYVHSSYGMVSWDPRYLDYCEINGKTFTLVPAFVVSAGNFGGYNEILELP